MASIFSQKLFFKGSKMDTDSDPRYIKPGDSPYRRNAVCDLLEAQRLGDIFGIKGNTKVNYTQPAGTNKVIGTAIDYENHAIIYFVYNSNLDHQIRRWYVGTDNIELILQDSLLNFKLTHKITHANVIGGMLYWTDGYDGGFGYDGNGNLDFNPPRKINIQKALDYTNGLTTGYSNITFETLDRIKYRPPTPPTVAYKQDTLLPYNNVFGKLHQFFYKWIYDDDEETVWSEMSKMAFPIKTWRHIGNLAQDENTIDVTFKTGSEHVRKIVVGVKQNNIFTKVKVIEKFDDTGTQVINDNIDHTIAYTGVERIGSVDPDDFLIQYHYVPQISRAQELIGSRLIDGDITEDYDKITPDVLLSMSIYNRTSYVNSSVIDPGSGLPNTQAWSGTPTSNYHTPIPTFKNGGLYQLGLVYRDRAGRSSDVITSDDMRLDAPYFWENATLTNNLFDPIKLDWEIYHQPPVWATHWQWVITKDLRYLKKTQFVVSETSVNRGPLTIYLPEGVNYSFTKGDRIRLVWRHYPNDYDPFGAVAFNVGPTDEGVEILPKSSNQEYEIIDPQVGSANLDYDWAIEDFDPSSWLIYLDKKSGNDFTDIIDTPSGDNVFAKSAQHLLFEIYNTNKQDSENKIFYSFGEEYEIGSPHTAGRYHKGDTANQVVGTPSAPATGTIYGWDAYLRKNIFKINAYYNILIDPGDNVTGYVDANDPYGWHSSQDTINFELDSAEFVIGMDFNGVWFKSPTDSEEATVISVTETTHPNTGTPVVQVVLSASVVGAYGDTGNYMRVNNLKKVDVWIESDSFSDKYESAVCPESKVNLVIEGIQRKRYEDKLRWGGKYFQESFINNLSNFEAESYKYLGEEFNQVTRLSRVGFTLKAHQKNKVHSIYLDRREFNDSLGQSQVQASDQIVGSIRTSEESYGSLHPAADVKSGRHTYFIDTINGKVIRDAANGMIPISGDKENPNDQYKMHEHFLGICREMHAYDIDSFDIIGVYDQRTECYILTINDPRANFTGGQAVLNGNFTSATGWATDPDVNIVSGGCQFNSPTPGAAVSQVLQTELVAGHEYTLTWSIGTLGLSQSGSYNVNIGGNTIATYNAALQTNVSLTFVSPVTTSSLSFQAAGVGCNFTLDNVSLITDAVQNLSQTLMFHEPSNGWKCFVDYSPEYYASHGGELISFKDGELWHHYTNDLYNNFYGVQYDMEVDIVVNEAVTTIKTFNNITLNSNSKWEVSPVTIDANVNAPNGMTSIIPKARFRGKEGKLHADFLRDMSDPNYSNETLALLNGRKLRGEYATVKLINDDDYFVYLNSAIVHFTISNLT